MSANGLTAIVPSFRIGGRDHIYSSTRSSPSNPFGAPSNADFVNLNSTYDTDNAVMRADGLEIIYTQFLRIYVATRVSTAVPFSTGVYNSTLSPYLSD